MLDASAKIPNGIFKGNLYDFGSFEECLDFEATSVKNVQGKYCLGSIHVDPKLYSQVEYQIIRITSLNNDFL